MNRSTSPLVKGRGYALFDEQAAFGLRTVATSVLDAEGAPVGGMSLMIPSERSGIWHSDDAGIGVGTSPPLFPHVRASFCIKTTNPAEAAGESKP